MTRLTILAALTASALFAQAGVAQQNDVDPAAAGGINVQNTALAALGSLVAGPYDVETAPFDNRCLGVTEMGGFLWVTGGGHATIGWSFMIHQYDMTGNFIQSFPQVSNATSWGGRDMSSVKTGASSWTLYAGSDNAELSEYSWDGVTLTHVALHSIAALSGTVRALCQRPSDGHFFSKSFTSSHYEFTIAAGVLVTSANAALSAYGYGWDDASQSIWSTTTGPAVQEVDAACVNKAGGFGLTWGTAQGGADVYVDSRNPGFCSMVILGQGTPDSMEVYDLAVVCGGPPVYTVTKTGTCPGLVTLSSANGTPNRPSAVLYGNAGSFTKPSGACAGLTLGISQPTLAVMLNNNAQGAASVSFNTSPAFCGKTVQFVDVTSCTASNAVIL